MRWKYPQHGEEQVRTYFTLLPRRGTDGYWYWLSRITETREYYCYCYYPYSYWELISRTAAKQPVTEGR